MNVIIILGCLLGFLAFRSLRTPALALVAVYCMFALEQWAQANSALFSANTVLINIAVAGIVAIGLVARYLRGLNARERMFRYYPIAGVLIVLLFSYALLTTLWTTREVQAPLRWLAASPYWMVVVIAAPLLFREPKELAQAFAWQIVFGGIVAALLFFGTEWQGRVIVLNQETIEMTNVGQGNPLATAEMAGITILCATFAAISFRGSTLLRLAVTALCLLVIVRSGSRGQLIGLAVALVAAFPIRYSIVRARVFGVTAFAGLMGILLTAYGLAEYWGSNSRFSEAGATSDYALRIEMVTQVLRAWLADTSAVAFGLGNSSSFDPAIAGYYPHVVPVEILAEEGLLGALLYFAALVAIVVGVFRATAARGRDSEVNAALATAVAVIIYSFLLSLKQGSLLNSTTFFMSVIVVAKVCSAIRSQYSSAPEKAARIRDRFAADSAARASARAMVLEPGPVGVAKPRQHAR